MVSQADTPEEDQKGNGGSEDAAHNEDVAIRYGRVWKQVSDTVNARSLGQKLIRNTDTHLWQIDDHTRTTGELIKTYLSKNAFQAELW